jgi:hydrogenase assembly chaperone HypC/HupF
MSQSSSTPSDCAGDHCITCADDGVPMTVVRIDEERGLALCADADGVRHTVETALVEPVAAGAVLLVHAGVAIAALAGAAVAGAALADRMLASTALVGEVTA